MCTYRIIQISLYSIVVRFEFDKIEDLNFIGEIGVL